MPWNQIHAKVAAAFASGAVVSIVVAIFVALGHPLPTDWTAVLTTVAASLAGYLTPSNTPAKPVVVTPPAPPAA